MAKTKNYQHFCPVARSLEVIGEKWSLLVVRDLLRGPQRFSDLHRYLGGITPKWLSQRLRDLEEAGIVERQAEAGKREVWYRLTPRGRDLAPVIRALVVWGIDHAMRPPLPGEVIHPQQTLQSISAYLNERRRAPASPVTWRFEFGEQALEMRYDGARWSSRPADDGPADVTVTATPRQWIEAMVLPLRERGEALRALDVSGARARVDEFARVLSGDDGEARGRRRRVPPRVALEAKKSAG